MRAGIRETQIMAVRGRLITMDEFEEILARPENSDRLLELIHGEIVEKMPTWEHDSIALEIGTEFNLYLRKNPIGRASVESRHRPAGDKLNDRIPDIAVVLGMDKLMVRKGATEFIPDLCVEVQSSDDSAHLMLEKARFYLGNGCKMAWLVYPGKRLVEVLTPNDRHFYSGDDVISAEVVLPGFTMSVGDVFRSV
jgi:Uma2 family endonuclease